MTWCARCDKCAALFAALSMFLPPELGAQQPDTVPHEPDTVVADPHARGAPGDTLERRPVALEELRVRVTRSERPLERLPFAVSLAGPAGLQGAERSVSLAEGLRGIPGVFVQNRRNFSLGDRLTIRGVGSRAQFGVRGIQVLADGIPLTLPDGQAALNNLDLSSAGRVEVIRGPASALYGNAAGGVLSYWTEEFASRPLRLSPEVTAGSHGFLATRLQASGSGEDIGYLANFRRVETRGFREYGAAEMYQFNAVGRWAPAERTELRAVANLFDMPFAENPSSLDRRTAMRNPGQVRDFIISQGAGEENTQAQVGLTLRQMLGGGSGGGSGGGGGARPLLRVSAWGLVRDVWNPIPGRIIDLDRTALGIRSTLEGEAPVLAAGRTLHWVVGADAALQRDERRESDNLGVGERGGRAREGVALVEQLEQVRTLGPFAEVSLHIAEDWTVTAGGRLDLYRFEATDRMLGDGDDSGARTLSHLSPMAGVTWNPSDAVGLYLNFATAFSTPTTSELSNRPDGAGGFNDNLDPQVIRSLEAGMRGWVQPIRVRYGLAGYVSSVDDALVPFQGAGEEVFFRNAGEVSRDGVEAELAWLPHPRVEGRLAYTFQDFVLEEFVTDGGDFSGNLEPGVPRHRVFASLSYRAPFGLRSAAEVRWVDAFAVDDANAHSNWSSRVVDLRFGLDLELGDARLEPFLGIDNLFDERYNASVVPNAFGNRFYEPAPGREVYGGIEVPVPVL